MPFATTGCATKAPAGHVVGVARALFAWAESTTTPAEAWVQPVNSAASMKSVAIKNVSPAALKIAPGVATTLELASTETVISIVEEMAQAATFVASVRA